MTALAQSTDVIEAAESVRGLTPARKACGTASAFAAVSKGIALNMVQKWLAMLAHHHRDLRQRGRGGGAEHRARMWT